MKYLFIAILAVYLVVFGYLIGRAQAQRSVELKGCERLADVSGKQWVECDLN